MRYQHVKKLLSSVIVLMVFALIAPVQGFGQRDDYQKSQGERKIQFKIPESLKAEHVELHEDLARAIKAGGKTAEAARAVEDVLHPHFLKEEEYALPPLGLLSSLAEGNVSPEMRTVIAMSDKLKADLPHMLQEHRAIVATLEKLSAAAKMEGKTEHALFAQKLMMHARNEEEVLYPATILVGEYLKMKLN